MAFSLAGLIPSGAGMIAGGVGAALSAGGIALPAARIGDADIWHCNQPFRMTGSPNVFINGRPASCQLDFNTPHLMPVPGAVCVTHIATISLGSFSVRINGRGAGRVTDTVFMCTAVMTGSFNVRIGG